jgi:uncharacterized membrane protein
MKYYFTVLLVLFLPFSAWGEVIDSFAADITINQDGSILVEETIIYDFESAKRHGIYRTIPTRFEVGSEPRKLEIDIQSVERDGQLEPYVITSTERPWKVRIGDADVEITGEHTYNYSYEVRGAIRYFEDYDELYWNVTGDEWEVPIDSWQARVQIADGQVVPQSVSCYQGNKGATSTCATTEVESSMAVFQGGAIQPREQATIGVALPKAVAEPLVLHPRSYWPYGLAALFLWLVYLMYFTWKRLYKNDTNQSIVTQFDSYQDISAVLTGYVLTFRLNPQIVTAGLVELVQQGYIELKQKTKSSVFGNKTFYLISCKKSDISKLSSVHQKILNLFFDTSRKLQNQVCDTSVHKIKVQDYQALSQSLITEVKKRGWQEKASFPWGFFGVNSIIVFCIGYALTLSIAGSVVITLFSSIILATLLGITTKRKTSQGYQAYYHTKGLYRYINVAEEDRVAFHNAPEKNPETFTKYLPYAIALKLEVQWLKQFQNMYISQEGIYAEDGSQLNLSNKVALKGMYASVQSVMPQKSRSGSTGGGHAGGGAGGGGGGSW